MGFKTKKFFQLLLLRLKKKDSNQRSPIKTEDFFMIVLAVTILRKLCQIKISFSWETFFFAENPAPDNPNEGYQIKEVKLPRNWSFESNSANR